MKIFTHIYQFPIHSVKKRHPTIKTGEESGEELRKSHEAFRHCENSSGNAAIQKNPPIAIPP
ncbi:MAG: hypothetical protein H6864_07020 [Micavibrio sp.]|nr:hypothetical protein [Micavibrio sp.]